MSKSDKPYSLESCRSFCNDGQIFPAMQYKIDKEGKPKKQAGREVEEETDGVVTTGRAIQVYRRRTGGTDVPFEWKPQTFEEVFTVLRYAWEKNKDTASLEEILAFEADVRECLFLIKTMLARSGYNSPTLYMD